MLTRSLILLLAAFQGISLTTEPLPDEGTPVLYEWSVQPPGTPTCLQLEGKLPLSWQSSREGTPSF